MKYISILLISLWESRNKYQHFFIAIDHQDEDDVKLLKQQSISDDSSEGELDKGPVPPSFPAKPSYDHHSDSDSDDGMTMNV